MTVRPRGTLRLSSGIYLFDSISQDPESTLVANTSAGPVVIYIKTAWAQWGKVTQQDGRADAILWGYLGTAPVQVAAPFSGSIVAPNASITLSSNGLNPTFFGTFLARDIAIGNNVTVQHVPFVVAQRH